MSALLQHASPIFAANNVYQPYTIPDNNPESYDDIKKVIIERESSDPMENIHENLDEAFSGGWDWEMEVNGVFDQQEAVCPPSVDEPLGARCKDRRFTYWRKIGNDEWEEEILCPRVDNKPLGAICRTEDHVYWEKTGLDEWTERLVCESTAGKSIGDLCEDTAGSFWRKTGSNQWTQDGTGATQDDAAMEASLRVPRTISQETIEANAEIPRIRTDAEVDSNSKRTNPSLGLIPKVEGVPGRDTEQAYGNIRSGLGKRRETGGDARVIIFSPILDRRVYKEPAEYTGFDYPTNPNTCGLTTVCRPPGHTNTRGVRDRPPFFCQHPCQRPLDDDGKPENWDEEDSTKAPCGDQDPYEPNPEDLVAYSCGGKKTKGPGEGFCGELNANGQLGGVCQDMNSWVYILWKKLVHICLIPTPIGPIPVPIYRYEKGECGFPAETENSENSKAKREDGWSEDGRFECCSDSPYSGGATYDKSHKGESCIACTGEDCRLHPTPKAVIVNEAWLDPFPADLFGGCLIGIPLVPDDPIAPEEPENPENPIYLAALAIYNAAIAAINAVKAAIDGIENALIALGFDPEDLGVNIGAWSIYDENLRKTFQDREYISYFRDYNNASYERSTALTTYVPNDEFKKENIPVACYGMYDLAPEDAKLEQIEPEDKRCTIAAYYPEVNFQNMKNSQRGIGKLKDILNDNPFGNPSRPFTRDTDLWWPQLGAFSMINDEVFSGVFHGDFSFTLLTTDHAKQRSTVQLDTNRLLSDGARIRTPDDTITIEKDLRKHRRTMVEWWHMVETEMHKSFTPPTVRLLLPTTWTIDLNPLDPLYTPPDKPAPGELSPDIRSESIEIQVQATEDLLGDVVSFMERALLLRIEGEPVPIVVPIVNPTELRAVAQGWEVWGKKQEKKGLPGKFESQVVANQLKEYADQADKVRKLRAQLPRYAGAMLNEQRKVTQTLADWMNENLTSYRSHLFVDESTQLFQARWRAIQTLYRASHDDTSFPWPRTERFTSPVYSFLDPWLPGRENEGDTTAGMKPYNQCLAEASDIDLDTLCTEPGQTLLECIQTVVPSCIRVDLTIFEKYFDCVEFVVRSRITYGEGVFPTLAVCERFYPTPPLLPELPDVARDADMVLDFTAFREPQRTIKLPILKPIQIRIDFDDIDPPPLEQDKEPEEYPILADLPEFPDTLSNAIIEGLPIVINPAGNPDFDSFKEAAVLTVRVESAPGDPFPKIKMPSVNFFELTQFLTDTDTLIRQMTQEYDLFWRSLMLKKCDRVDPSGDCVRSGTEQDCVEPHGESEKKCVHFEADLDERFQRIGSRPPIFLKDDLRAIGEFRDPIIHGQTYCEREDWACQLYNFYERKPREGWMLDITDDYNPEQLLRDVRKNVREESSNIITNPDQRFRYDMPQEEMFENFRVPEGERIERYIERFQPEELEENEVCNDAFCEIVTPPSP